MPPFRAEKDDDFVDRLIFIPPIMSERDRDICDTDTFSTATTLSASLKRKRIRKESPPPSSSILDQFMSLVPCVARSDDNPFRVAIDDGIFNYLAIPKVPNPSSAISKVRNWNLCGQGCNKMDGYVVKEVFSDGGQEEGEEVDIVDFVDFVERSKLYNEDWCAKRNAYRAAHSKLYSTVMHDLLQYFRAIEEEAADIATVKANTERETVEEKKIEDRLKRQENSIVTGSKPLRIRKTIGYVLRAFNETMKNSFSFKNCFSNSTRCMPEQVLLLPKTTQPKKKFSSRRSTLGNFSTCVSFEQLLPEVQNRDEINFSAENKLLNPKKTKKHFR